MNDLTKEPSSSPDNSRFRWLRTWPAVLLLLLMVLARVVPNFLDGGPSRYWVIGNFGPALCGVLMLIWWLAVSRATWRERVFGFLGIIGALALAVMLSDPTLRGPGTMYLTIPMGMFLFGVAAVLLAKRRPIMRTGWAVLLALVGFSYSALLRSDGMNGEYAMELHWRWTKSAEETLLASGGSRVEEAEARGVESGKTNDLAATIAEAEWPAFRGADRSGHVRGAQIATNWATQAPRQLWKISVGPAWSSFAVAGKFLFTQEQFGPKEAVVCYDADSGRLVWKQEIEARLEDPMGGPGPRATPTLADAESVGEGGGLFAVGSTGILMRLDPKTGRIGWQQNLKEVAGREKMPMWGFAGSPLVTKGVVIVWGGGQGDKGLLAFDVEKGALRWSVGGAGVESYSSPQLNRLAGEELVLLVSEAGLLCVDPTSGKARLNYPWKFNGYRTQQPTVIGDTVLMYSGMSPGSRAIKISKTNGELNAEELWTARNLKPDFTDFVVHEGYLYGIDGGFMTCVEVASGERKWRDGRYGKGQLVLLKDSQTLLVAAEDGRVVLLAASPAEHKEIGSFKALEGKTWNHPVVVGDRLYVRNAQEAACYQLAAAETKTVSK